MNDESQSKVNTNKAVNVTTNDLTQTKIEEEDTSKNRKVLKYSVIGGGILLAIVLIVVLSVTLTDREENNGPLPPNPPGPAPIPALVNPYTYQEYNLFTSQATSGNDWAVSTTLSQKQTSLQSSLYYLEDSQNGKIYRPVNPSEIPIGDNNQMPDSVQLSFAMIDNYQVVLNVTDPTKDNFAVPESAFARPVLSHEARFTQVGFSQASGSTPYHFNLSNIYNNETIFSTYKRKLFVSDKFSEIGFILPNARIFGLGQHNSQFQLKNGTYTLWAKDNMKGLPQDNQEGGLNGAHIHPFVLGQTNNKDFYGIFFAGSTAQSFEVVYFQTSDSVVLNYIQLGGQMEIYFMMRGTAAEILTRYHTLIGYSYVPPYYALGFFQGSDAYTSAESVETVMTNYAGSNMALEGVIVDNYYAGAQQVFTVNSDFKSKQAELAQKLADSNQHILLGLSSGLADGYTYSDNLKNSKAFIASGADSSQPYVGIQGDNKVSFADYLNDNVDSFLKSSLQDLDNSFNFQGLLLKQNQPYSQESEVTTPQDQIVKRVLSEQDTGNWDGSYKINSDQSIVSADNPPFVPGYYHSGDLESETISLSALHQIEQSQYQELYCHNLNGHMQLKKTYETLTTMGSWSAQGERPMIFSDSTWAGSGKYGGVALTNMKREWESLRNSISMAMSFGMYGVSSVASDVCGNVGEMDEELCGRWAQLSAFLPLMRNYYTKTYYDSDSQQEKASQPQEFYNFENYNYEFMASSALNQRLPLTRYIYSQLYKVYLRGGAVVYPLFFDYPEDDETFADIEHTYMLGEALKVSPVLSSGVSTTFQSYFPQGKWADMNDFSNIFTSNGNYISLNQSYAFTNVHLKEGKIVPYQPNPNHYKQTYDFLHSSPMSFVVHRDGSSYAEGFVLADDGSSADSWDTVDFAFWKLRYAQKSINFWIDWGNFTYDSKDLTIDTLGQIHIVDAEDLAGTNFACYLGQNLNPVNLSYEYNPYNQVLTIKPQPDQVVKFKDIGLVKFGNSFQEVNECDYQTAFTYKIDNIDVEQSTDQKLVMSASSLQGTRLLPELVVTVTLLDDQGTINLNITTQEDYNNNGKTIFKPQNVADFTNFPSEKVTKRLDSFFTFSANPFSYEIFLENSPSLVVYKSDPHKLFFDKYMVFDSGIFSLNKLNNNPLLGMGERAGSLFYKEDGIHSRYTFDQANPIDDGYPPGRNMYGFQPMYMYQSSMLRWVGVFDLNSYATDYLLQFNDGVDTQITKVSIGGSIQKYFFLGTKPDDIIITYEKLTGMPLVPPLWTFGWQQCRFGWTNDQEWIDVVYSYSDNNIPLDTMWADIDYMDDYKIFTIADRYSNLATYVNQIHQKGMTFVPIMDVGVAVRPSENYVAYDEGISQDIFIKQSDGSAPLTAGVWCGHAYFPDFFHENIDNYWHQMFQYLTDEYGLTFDGIWIDMNEATNFCNGYCITSERPVDSLRNKPYYVPGWRDLEDKALGVDGLHPKAWNGQDLHEYDVHSMYSLMQVKSTSTFLSEKLGLRPYVLSRSNFPGLQKYGHHWMGDNWSTVEYMKLSVDGIYSYNLFGLPFMGSDICGFDGDATGQQGSYLCARWHQLGSLYPFARNHNQNDSTSQEPYVFNTTYYQTTPVQISYTDIIRTALRNRYQFIKYYYSRFNQMSQYGGSFFKPLFYEFPNDPKAYNDIEINILLGDALKASIQVTTIDEQDTTNFPQTAYYFPSGTWCQILPQLSDDATQCFTAPTQGSTISLDSTLPNYQIHLRGGYIVPTQDSMTTNVNTTKDLESVYTDYWVLPNTANSDLSLSTGTYSSAAVGYIYYDDGVSMKTPNRFDLSLTLNGDNAATLNINQFLGDYTKQNLNHEKFGKLYILQASQCKLNGVTQAIATMNNAQNIALNTSYDAKTNMVTVVVASGSDHLSIYDIAKIDLS